MDQRTKETVPPYQLEHFNSTLSDAYLLASSADSHSIIAGYHRIRSEYDKAKNDLSQNRFPYGGPWCAMWAEALSQFQARFRIQVG